MTIMSSASCDDAFEGVLKLGLKGPAQREISRVIIDCCGQEQSFNPFYAQLAERLCDANRQHAFTLQLCFWDVVKAFADDKASPRRASNVGRLLAYLLSIGKISLLGFLKGVDNLSATSSEIQKLFFTVCFDALVKSCTPEKLKGLALRLVGLDDMTLDREDTEYRPPSDEAMAARDALSLFLHAHVKSPLPLPLLIGGPKQQPRGEGARGEEDYVGGISRKEFKKRLRILLKWLAVDPEMHLFERESRKRGIMM